MSVVAALAAMMMLGVVAVACVFFKRNRAITPAVEERSEEGGRISSVPGSRGVDTVVHAALPDLTMCFSCTRSVSVVSLRPPSGRTDRQGIGVPSSQPGYRGRRRRRDVLPGIRIFCVRPRVEGEDEDEDEDEVAAVVDSVAAGCSVQRTHESGVTGLLCRQPPTLLSQSAHPAADTSRPPDSVENERDVAKAGGPPVDPASSEAETAKAGGPPVGPALSKGKIPKVSGTGRTELRRESLLANQFAWSAFRTDSADKKTCNCCGCNRIKRLFCCGCSPIIGNPPSPTAEQADSFEAVLPGGNEDPSEGLQLSVGFGGIIQPVPSKPQQQQPKHRMTDNAQHVRWRMHPPNKVGQSPLQIAESADSDTETVKVDRHAETNVDAYEATEDIFVEQGDVSALPRGAEAREEPVLGIRFPGPGVLRSGISGTWSQAEIDKAGGDKLTLLSSIPEHDFTRKDARDDSEGTDDELWESLPSKDVFISPERMKKLNALIGREKSSRSRNKQEMEVFLEEVIPARKEDQKGDNVIHVMPATSAGDTSRGEPASASAASRVAKQQEREDTARRVAPVPVVVGRKRFPRPQSPAVSSMTPVGETGLRATTAVAVTKSTSARPKEKRSSPVKRSEPQRTVGTGGKENVAAAAAALSSQSDSALALSSQSDSALLDKSTRLRLAQNAAGMVEGVVGPDFLSQLPPALQPDPVASQMEDKLRSRRSSAPPAPSSVEMKPSTSSSGLPRIPSSLDLVLRELNINDVTYI